MSDETVSELDSFAAPWGKEIKLQAVLHDSGLRMLRIRIKEGSRFTVLDIDAQTATRWAAAMTGWAGAAAE